METLVIQSDINNIVEVERFVYSVCDTFNINNYSAVITMSLLQAVENAIVHGNNNDVSKKVTVNFDQCRGGVYFTVTDEGKGFDFRSSVANENNKGLFLMHSLADHLLFYDNGSTVRMDYVINGIEACRAIERVSILRRHYAVKAVKA